MPVNKPYTYQQGKKPQGGPSYQGHQSTRRPPPAPCYLCNGKHWTSDCPTRKKITALIAKHSDSEESDEEKPTAAPRVGALQLINAMVKKEATSKRPTKAHKGLSYVDITLGGRPTQALVDAGATHNFISLAEAKRLGLTTTKQTGWVKAVNSGAKARPMD